MVGIQTILTYLTLVSIPVGVAYHIMTLNNTRKNQQMQLETRQVQLFESFVDKITPELWSIQNEVCNEWKWENPEDFIKKYGLFDASSESRKLVPLLSIYERMGILMKEGVLNIEIMYDMVGGNPIRLWEKIEPIADYYRIHHEMGVKGMMWEYFEDFAYALMEVRDKDREKFNKRYQKRKQTRAKYGKTIPEYNP